MDKKKYPIIIIVGPTASGKSALAMQIAKENNGEIICADSRTVYKGMDIGTAKPTKQDQREVPHHLIDIVEPNQPFNAADFKRLADEAVDKIISRNKVPIIVGGTGLYIDSVFFNYDFGKPANYEDRIKLLKLDNEELQEICRKKSIPLPRNFQNKRHLVRTIELGGPVNQNKMPCSNTLIVAIDVDKKTLKDRIERRASEMLEQGALKETTKLAKKYGWENEAMTGNIYRTLKSVILGDVDLEEARSLFVKSDLSLAKRQMTWFKRNPYIIWGDSEKLKPIIELFIREKCNE